MCSATFKQSVGNFSHIEIHKIVFSWVHLPSTIPSIWWKIENEYFVGILEEVETLTFRQWLIWIHPFHPYSLGYLLFGHMLEEFSTWECEVFILVNVSMLHRFSGLGEWNFWGRKKNEHSHERDSVSAWVWMVSFTVMPGGKIFFADRH